MADGSSRRLEMDEPPPKHFVFAPGDKPARNRPGFYVLSLILFLLIALLLQVGAAYLLVQWSHDNRALRTVLNALRENNLDVSWRWMFFIFAITYACFWIALILAVMLAHGRSALSLFTDGRRFSWNRAFWGFVLYTVLLAGPLVYVVLSGDSGLKPHFDARIFAELLLYSVLVLVIQTTAEELLFRGYLTQFAASIFESRMLIVLVPSVLFMLAHIGNPELAGNAGVIGFYLGFGIFMSLIVLRERGLELAIGAHFANNLINSVLIRGPDSVFQTPSIFVLPASDGQTPLLTALGGLFVPAVYWVLTAAFIKRRDYPTNP